MELPKKRKLFNKPHIAILINPSEIRKYSIFLLNTVLDKVQAVKTFIKNPEIISKNTREKLKLNKDINKKPQVA